MCAWVRRVPGRAELLCVCLELPPGEALCGSSGLDTELLALHLLIPGAMGRGHPTGEPTAIACKLCPALREPTYLAGEVLALR